MMNCNECGLPFDESDLSQVLQHEHKGLKINNTYNGKKVINNAREVFPEASVQFCMGVHNYLSGKYDLRELYKEHLDFKSGYYQAMEMDLETKVILKK